MVKSDKEDKIDNISAYQNEKRNMENLISKLQNEVLEGRKLRITLLEKEKEIKSLKEQLKNEEEDCEFKYLAENNTEKMKNLMDQIQLITNVQRRQTRKLKKNTGTLSSKKLSIPRFDKLEINVENMNLIESAKLRMPNTSKNMAGNFRFPETKSTIEINGKSKITDKPKKCPKRSEIVFKCNNFQDLKPRNILKGDMNIKLFQDMDNLKTKFKKYFEFNLKLENLLKKFLFKNEVNKKIS